MRRFLARFALVDEERTRTRQEMQRLRDDLDRVHRENAAILRLVARPGRESTTLPPAPPGLSHDGLFTEVERGSRAEVMSKLQQYMPFFRDASPVVDLGCGRGEFLELAGRHGLAVHGVDTDPESVRRCRDIDLDAREENLFDHIAGMESESVGGVFCSQVVEHLPPETIPVLLEQIARVLRPGGVAVLETPNPASFATHVQSFWRDPTHIRPVPHAALAFAARSAGLVVGSTIYSSLPPDAERLKPLAARPAGREARDLVRGVNGLVHQLNALLYGPQDYALVVSKPSDSPGPGAVGARG
jgi:O-antigen chain-terminating methyltransferase